MAIYHCSIQPVSRGAGRSATAAAAYRAAEKIKDATTGERHDYSRRRGVESAALVYPAAVPEEAKASRAALWNMAEAAERRADARVAREYVVALPAELPAAERRELALEFARALADRYGCAADCCVHAPSQKGDERNHHAHILTTVRKVGADGTLGKKCDCELSDKDRKRAGLRKAAEDVREVRQLWADLCNRALARAGAEERVDAGRRADGLPTIHLGPAASEMERRGEQSGRGEYNRAVAEARAAEQQAPAQPEQAPAAAEPEGPAPAAPSPEEEAAIAATIDEMCGTFEEPPAPAEKSDLEKRRDVILAHPQCIGNNGAREALTRDGWEQWVEPLELALGIGGKEKEQPQPAKEKTPEEIEDERIDRECEAKAAEWEQLVSARASQIWSAADKAEKAARDEWCKARDQLDALKEQKKQLGTLAKWRGKDKELDAEAGRLTAAQKAAYGRELEAQARKDNARALAEKELRAKLKPEEREHLDKCLARAKERRAERDRQLAIEQEKQRAQQRPARSQGRGWSR